MIGGFVLDVHGSVARARAYCKWFRPIADPLTLYQADQARADFAAKCISLICDAHIIPFGNSSSDDRISESNNYLVTTAEQVNKLMVPAKQPSVAL